jgi:hypothetical protein
MKKAPVGVKDQISTSAGLGSVSFVIPQHISVDLLQKKSFAHG